MFKHLFGFYFSMDDKVTLKEIKNKIQKFCEARDWDQFHNAKDLAIGVSTEASELLEHFRFKSDKEIELLFSNNDTRNAIGSEMADVLWFLSRLAQRYNFDLSNELTKVIEKNEKRYSVDKIKGSNKKYTEI